MNVWVILDVYGEYWFSPSWSQSPDWEALTGISAGEVVEIETLPTFVLPDFEGEFALRFWSGLTYPDNSDLIGGEFGIEWVDVLDVYLHGN
ncbi:MAG: hypothetical protein PHU71_05310 [Candidatus Gracilibacteria bacterium]|nr:hypothetical protein [Candidatus Gracilibacteria bacterium]